MLCFMCTNNAFQVVVCAEQFRSMYRRSIYTNIAYCFLRKQSPASEKTDIPAARNIYSQIAMSEKMFQLFCLSG